MPELPEVETVARTLAPHIINCVFTNSTLYRPDTLLPFSMPLETLSGLSVKNIKRRGKLLMLGLGAPGRAIDNLPHFLVFHLRMTGRLLTKRSGTVSGRHTRCLFHMRDARNDSFQLVFDDMRAFGKILVATNELLETWPFWNKLGPEPLDIDKEAFSLLLKGSKPIKTALLDQQIIAGIGNIYADESLFYSGIHPLRKAVDLKKQEKCRLLDSIQSVLEKAIAQGGSSIRDYVDANGKSGAFQESFAVYGRSGQKCIACGEVLQKIKVGGRATVFCPRCQK